MVRLTEVIYVGGSVGVMSSGEPRILLDAQWIVESEPASRAAGRFVPAGHTIQGGSPGQPERQQKGRRENSRRP